MNTAVQLFKSVLGISLFASAMIIIVLLVKAIAKDRINIKAISLLWFLAILRLCIPGMLESPVHLDGLFPETAVSQEAADQPAFQDAALGGGQNDISGSTLPEYTAEPPAGNTAPDNIVTTEPQPVSFFGQVSRFIESIDIWTAAAILWILGGAVVLSSALKESVAFSLRRRKHIRSVTDTKILGIVKSYRKANRLRRRIRVFTCSSIQMPMAMGLFHPQILLPLGLTKTLSEEHISAILLHEICHIKRNDILINYACVLAKALHWFNPLVWIGLKKMKADLEFACDQKVLRLMRTGQEIKYCESLLYATRFMKQRKIPQLATSLCESKSNLRKRIMKMVRPRRQSKPAAAMALVLALIMAVACFTTACQPTPEKPAVVGRQDDIISEVSSVPSEDFKPVAAPGHISEVYDDYPYLKITYDADVVVPETTAYPVTEVAKRSFSDDDILSFIKLCAGSDYELYSSWEPTKDDYLGTLTKLKQYEGTWRVTQDNLDMLQELYDDAANDVENPKISSLSELPAGSHQTVFIKAPDGKVGDVSYGWYGNDFSYVRDFGAAIYTAGMTEDSQYDKNMDGSYERFEWLKPGEPEISREDALAAAQQYMDEMGIDLDLYSAEPCSFITDLVDKTTGWQFVFMRSISNLRTIDDTGGFYTNPDAPPSYASPWGEEKLTIDVNKGGLSRLWWMGASNISRTVTGSAQLEDFEAIQQRITDQLSYMYVWGEEQEKVFEIKITKAELGISMMSVEDEPETGEYIPTWYVTYYHKFENESEYSPEIEQIMFSAVDGSYIEPRLTNKDLMRSIFVGSDSASVGGEVPGE